MHLSAIVTVPSLNEFVRRAISPLPAPFFPEPSQIRNTYFCLESKTANAMIEAQLHELHVGVCAAQVTYFSRLLMTRRTISTTSTMTRRTTTNSAPSEPAKTAVDNQLPALLVVEA